MTNPADSATQLPPNDSHQALHPRFAEIVDYMADTRFALIAYVQSLTDEQRAFRAAPGRWSVLENLEHLGTVEDSIGRLFSKLAKQLREAGAAPDAETSSVMQSIDKHQVPSAPQRIQAPERLHPTGQLSMETSLERLAETRARLLEAIRAANGLPLNTVSAPHPLFGPIDGYGWLVFVPQHELRHMRQMRENVAALTP